MSHSQNSVELEPDPPQTQQTPLHIHIVSALSEIMFIVSELMLGIPCINFIQSQWLPFDRTNYVMHILFDACAYILLITFIIWSVAFNIKLKMYTIIIRLGLNKTNTISVMVGIILVLHCLGLLVNYALFTYYNEWLFTMSNITDSFNNNSLNYYRMFDLFICSPIREEIVHRGLVFLLLYRHVNPMNYSHNQQRNSNYTKSNLIAVQRTIIVSGIVFGSIHAFNLFDTTYSKPYVMAQIIVGCIVSFFYSLRMVITTSLWEPIVLHIINNVFAAFIDFSSDDVTHPLVLLPIVFSMLLYVALIYWSWKHQLLRVWRSNKRKKKKLFLDFIDGQDDNKQD
eukprot:37327_1